MEKVCNKCGVKKEFPAQFNKRNNYNPKSTKQYFKGHCRSCDVDMATKWVKEHKDRYQTYQSTYKKKLCAQHKKLGLCIYGSCKNKSANGKVSCEKHLAQARRKWHEYVKRKKSPPLPTIKE